PRSRASMLLGKASAAPEQAFEEVAETAARTAACEDLVEIEAFRAIAMAVAVATGGRRLHLVAGAITTRAQLVVGSTLLRIAQRLVGFVDGLELLLGAGFLADVGMVLARQPPVRGLDLGVARVRFDAQGLVIILELHGGSKGLGLRHRCRRPRLTH